MPRFFRSFFAIFLFASTTLSAAPNVADTVERYAALRLGPARSVSGFEFTVGHARFSLPAGTATGVMAGDEEVGLFLTGSGSFTYESVTPDEFTAIHYNAKRADLPVRQSGETISISDTFSSVLLVGSGLPPIEGADATPPTREFDSAIALFARDVFSTPFTHLMAYRSIEAPSARAVVAQVNGSMYPWIYSCDDAYARDESLTILRKQPTRTGKWGKTLWPTTLSTQPIGRDGRQGSPARMRLTAVDVDLTGHLNEQAKMTVVQTLVPYVQPARALRFDLIREYYADYDLPPRLLNVRKITDENGRELSFVHDRDDLLVSLAEPAPAGRPLKLTFEIDGNFLHRPDKSNYWQLGITPWFPWLRMHEQSYTFRAVVRAEKPFVPFASGKTVRRIEEGNYNLLETKIDQPVNAVSILAGKYQYEEMTRNDVTVRVASFISKNRFAYKSLSSIAFAAIEAFPRFLGPFPFDEINVIEMNDLGYGQAPAGIVFITKEAFHPKQAEANEYIDGVNMRFVHEIAHQYFGSAVLLRSHEEQWLDEAFAEYAAAIFLHANRRAHYQRAFNQWKVEAKNATPHAIIPMANRLRDAGDPVSNFRIRSGLIYAKGALLLAALHQELGDETFLTFLKSYQKSFRGKHASTDDVIGLLNLLTKKDYAPWFEKYFYDTQLPAVDPRK